MSGCHNQASYVNASGLLLDTWDHLFNGNDFGASVVPYWPQYSPLLYFVNPDSSLGPKLLPVMPVAGTAPAITKDEYQQLYDWIAKGAPDKNGNIAFASNPATRQKIYALCNDNNIDLVAVIDAERKVIMRYIKVGISDESIEGGHDIKISTDGTTAYETFYGGSVLQKMNVTTDAASGTANLSGAGSLWSLACLNPANTMIWVTSWNTDGHIVAVNTNTMTVDGEHTYKSTTYPHGIAATRNFDTFFVSAEKGNCIYKCTDPSNRPVLISLDGQPAVDAPSDPSENLGPHAVWMAPDYSKYFVTMQNTGDVKVVDAHTDAVLQTIHVGPVPQEIVASTDPSTPYIFVSCKEDSTHSAKGARGSVYVIDYNNYAIKTILYGDFFQPHGMAVDNQNHLLYVFSLNVNGATQHHAVKGNKDGWYTIYDIGTLTPYPGRLELKSFPYNGVARF
jgi:DNA-binding beta-propeller fold protein YncE